VFLPLCITAVLAWVAWAIGKTAMRVAPDGISVQLAFHIVVPIQWDDITDIRTTGEGAYRSLTIEVHSVRDIVARVPKSRRFDVERALRMPIPGKLALFGTTHRSSRQDGTPAGGGSVHVLECFLGQTADSAAARIAAYRTRLAYQSMGDGNAIDSGIAPVETRC
jgi:hypothetical protein